MKKMKNIKIFKPFSAILLLTLSLFLVSCEDDMSGDNLTNDDFISFSFDENVGLSEGASETMSVTVYAGSASNSDRTVGLYVDDSSTADAMNYSVASSVTIPAGSMTGTFDVSLTNNPDFGAAGVTVVVGMTLDAGVDQPTAFTGTTAGGDLNVTQDMFVITATTVCLDNVVTIDITLDSWPEELYWWIADLDGNIVADPGPYAQYANPYAGLSGGVVENLCIPSGSYIFNIYDDYGDGGGPISVTSGGTVIYSSAGGYGASDSAAFTL